MRRIHILFPISHPHAEGQAAMFSGLGSRKLDLLLNSRLVSPPLWKGGPEQSWQDMALLHHSVGVVDQDKTRQEEMGEGYQSAAALRLDHLTELRETGLRQHCQVFHRCGNMPRLMSSFP